MADDLFAVLERIVRGIVKEQRPPLYDSDKVKRVNGDGSLTLTSGRTTTTHESDQPVMPGDRVYVSRLLDGKIVFHAPEGPM